MKTTLTLLLLTAVNLMAQPDVRFVRTDSTHPPVQGLVIDDSKPLAHRMEIFDLDTSQMFTNWIRCPELSRHKMLGFDLKLVNVGNEFWNAPTSHMQKVGGFLDVTSNLWSIAICDRMVFPPYNATQTQFDLQTAFRSGWTGKTTTRTATSSFRASARSGPALKYRTCRTGATTWHYSSTARRTRPPACLTRYST